MLETERLLEYATQLYGTLCARTKTGRYPGMLTRHVLEEALGGQLGDFASLFTKITLQEIIKEEDSVLATMDPTLILTLIGGRLRARYNGPNGL